MSENEEAKVPNLKIQSTKRAGEAFITLGDNWVTGCPLVGDKIKLEDGRILVVTERTWLSGKQREANILLTVDLAE